MAPSPDSTTRERIILEAARQFARHGYEGGSLRKIAEGVGIRAASIFHHFPDGKEQLYAAIFTTVTDLIAVRLAENFRPDAEPVDAILEMSGVFWDFLAERGDIAALILRDAFDVPGQEHKFLVGADAVMATARQFLLETQERGLTRKYDPDFLMMWSASYCVTFHGAPGIQQSLFAGRDHAAAAARTQYLDAVRFFLGIEPE